MKRKIAAVIIIICILAAAFIVIKKVKNNPVNSNVTTESADEESLFGTPAAYVAYAGTYLLLDDKGLVCENSSDQPESIPKITGIDFSKLIYGKKAETANGSGLDYALDVASGLAKNNIKADLINFSKGTVTVIIDKLTIKFGRNDKTEDKINDLADLIDKVAGKDGTLNMQNADNNNNGYTFHENR